MTLDLPVIGASQLGDEAQSWPIESHRVLGTGSISDFVSDRVTTPTGESIKRDYLMHTGAVGIIALDESDRVVVVRQYRHPVGFRLVEPPAGLLDVDAEGALAAAQRELAEEAMLRAGRWDVLVDTMTSPGCSQESLRIYLARDLAPAPRPDGFVVEGEEAVMDVALVALTDLVDAIFAGRIQNPTMVAGTLATQVALGSGRELRRPDAAWPARDAKAARDALLSGQD